MPRPIDFSFWLPVWVMSLPLLRSSRGVFWDSLLRVPREERGASLDFTLSVGDRSLLTVRLSFGSRRTGDRSASSGREGLFCRCGEGEGIATVLSQLPVGQGWRNIIHSPTVCPAKSKTRFYAVCAR